MKCRKIYTKGSLRITYNDCYILTMLIFSIFQLNFGIYANDLKTNYQVFVNMQEELGRTAVVADLRKLFVEAVSQTSSNLIINSNFELQFKFLEPNPLFFLDTSNPHEQYLRVNSRVNREAVCSSEQLCCSTGISFNEYNKQSTVLDTKPCIIVLLLLVDLVDIRNRQNSFKESILQINIHVLDINDNAPEWSAHESLTISAQHVDKNSIIYKKLLELNKLIPKLDLTITEHTDIGTRIALPQAADPDARPENTTSIYGIYGQTTNGAFSLDWDTVAADTDSTSHNTGSGLWLRINMDLDYENQTVHQILIYASDAGKPSPLTGYLFINITVTDINDHPPLFLKKFDEIWIKEHSPIRTQIYRPIVTDKDITDRSRLKFGFSPSILGDTKQLFQIDKMTGSISLYGQVDFEHIHKHRLPIFVTDGKWTDESELIVNVVNLNDHLPKIQLHSPLKFKQNDRSFYFGSTLVDSLQSSRFHLTIVIKENGPPDQLVATVTVTDKDLTAELRARELNYASSVKEMPVVFSQRSLLKSSSEMNHSQNFRQPQILEPVCKVNHKAFQINPLQVGENLMESGRLRYKINLAGVSLDREQEARFFVPIECHDNDDYDSGYPFNARSDQAMLHISEYKRHTSTAILEVIVADENDCSPVIKGPLTGTLEEAAPIDTVVLKLSAEDADDPTTNAGNLGLRYMLVGEGQPQFTISKQENSNEDGSTKLQNLNLPPQPWFQLNSITGELKALVIFDREMIKSISLPIEVRDGGDNIKRIPNIFIENATTKVNSINATITIDIIDVNDCIPSFTQQIYEFNISEDARPPIRIGKIEAYDCDIDETNRNLNYWLQSVQHTMLTEKSNLPIEKDYFTKNTSYLPAHSTLTNWFSISKSGDLYFRMPQINSQLSSSALIDPLMPLDREKLELIIMDLFVKDSGKPSLTGSAQIVLRILDVNDNAPEWEFPRVQQRMINLSTDAAVGHRIVQLIATDPDEGLRGKVTYNLLSGNEGGQFELDSESGWLYLAQPLITYSSTVESNDGTTHNHNNNNGQQSNSKRWHSITTSMYRLYLQATDHGVPPKTSSSVLDIFVQKPFFSSSSLNGPQKSRLKIHDQKSNTANNHDNNNNNNGMNDYETEETLKLSSHSISNDVSNLWSSQLHQSHRGLLLSSDLLILIAMVIATLAALVLIFILFVIVRCRSAKTQQTIRTTESPYSFNDSQHNRIHNQQSQLSSTSSTHCNKKWHINFGTSNDLRRNKLKKILPESHFSLSQCLRSPQHDCTLPCHKSQTLKSGCLSGARYPSEQVNQDDDCRLTPLLLPSTSMKSDHQSDDVTVYSTRIPVSLSLLSSGPSSLDENYKSNDYSILLHTGHFIEPILAQPQCTHRYLNNVQSFKQNYGGNDNENWLRSNPTCTLLSTRPLYLDNNTNNTDNNIISSNTFTSRSTPHITVCPLNTNNTADDNNVNDVNTDNNGMKNNLNDQTKSIYLTGNEQVNNSMNHTYTPLKCNQHSVSTSEQKLTRDNHNSSFV